jgi:integration host factor subunit beta
MTRSDFLKMLSSTLPTLSVGELDKLLDVFFGTISECLINKDRAELRGLGAFSVRKRAPKMARNPRTNTKVMVGVRYSVHFRPSTELHNIN